jgi:alcohol dehydrogenase class IV
MTDTVLDPYFRRTEGGESAFSVEPAAITFGPGVLAEAGERAAGLGLRRIALFTDPRVRRLEPFAVVEASLRAAGLDVAVFDEVLVEPSDRSMAAAADFARDARVDGFVSVGGGSAIDTAKVANLLANWPAEIIEYVNAPLGAAREVPGPLKPHIACPTTFGTAAETTGIAVFDLTDLEVKSGIVSRYIRPTLGLLDPTGLYHLPPLVVAANGFDVLSHAIESYTARPFTARSRPATPSARPLSQGANPYGDLACLEAVRIAARHLEAAVNDPADRPARDRLMFAGLLAGIGFGNSGNHLPHAMSYPVSGQVRDYRAAGWADDGPLVPHGIAVVVNAPAAFRWTARATPGRHAAVLAAFGDDVAAGDLGSVGERLAGRLTALMRATGIPNGLSGVGYGEDDIDTLAAGAFAQKRLVDNAPRSVDRDDLAALFRAALRYW